MTSHIDLAKWTLTSGSEPQNFLGARWIAPLLRRLPADRRRTWALRILNMSPHYFIDGDNPEFAGMSTDDYLETSCGMIAASRAAISHVVFEPHLEQTWTVLEYGCGPGFLARAVAPHVDRLIACDISPGALACAEIVNLAPNVRYVRSGERGVASIADEQLDAVISFALVQHLTDDQYVDVLGDCRRTLRPGGRLLFHVQLTDTVWRTEREWVDDTTARGRLKLRFGLHCFGRSEEHHTELLTENGFADVELRRIDELADGSSTESERLLVATRR